MHRIGANPDIAEQQFRAVFDSAAEGMLVVDEKERCIDVNRVARKLFGLSRKRILRQKFQDLIGPVPEDRKPWQAFLNKDIDEFEYRVIRSSRKIRELRIKRKRNFVPGLDLIILDDVTEWKQAEEILRKQAQLLDLADDTIMIRNLNDIIIYWNQGAARLYGWSKEEALGKFVHSFLKTIFPEPFPQIKDFFLRSGYWSGMLIHTKRDGTQVIVDSRWTLEKDDRGKPTAYLEINNNITERRQAEEALKKAHDELEIRVQERTAELQEANKLLREQIAERKRIAEALRISETQLRALSSRLISAQEEERRRISRDLHDDLGQILTSMSLDLQRTLIAGDLEKKKSLITRVLHQNEGARNRLRELSSLLRPGVLDDVGLKEAIQTCAAEFAARAGVRLKLTLRCNNSDIPDTAKTNVYRILQEALTNISQYAQPGCVSISLLPFGKNIVLRVKDDGIGFDLASTNMNKAYGLLGMRERAELIGGKFRITTAPGRGVEVRISFPRAGSAILKS